LDLWSADYFQQLGRRISWREAANACNFLRQNGR
jgi:hypothetical protein